LWRDEIAKTCRYGFYHASGQIQDLPNYLEHPASYDIGELHWETLSLKYPKVRQEI
jgi:hypothetical protein